MADSGVKVVDGNGMATDDNLALGHHYFGKSSEDREGAVTKTTAKAKIINMSCVPRDQRHPVRSAWGGTELPAQTCQDGDEMRKKPFLLTKMTDTLLAAQFIFVGLGDVSSEARAKLSSAKAVEVRGCQGISRFTLTCTPPVVVCWTTRYPAGTKFL